MSKKKNEVCSTCPNNPWCIIYKKYGEVHTKTNCIDYTSEERYHIIIKEQIKQIKEDEKNE